MVSKELVYNKIASIEDKLRKTILDQDFNPEFWIVSSKFLTEITQLKHWVADLETEQKMLENTEREQDTNKCIQCGQATKYAYSLCADCTKEAGKTKKAYSTYVKEQKEKNEKQ